MEEDAIVSLQQEVDCAMHCGRYIDEQSYTPQSIECDAGTAVGMALSDMYAYVEQAKEGAEAVEGSLSAL